MTYRQKHFGADHEVSACELASWESVGGTKTAALGAHIVDRIRELLGDVNGNLKLTPFTLKQQSKIDPFDDLLRLNLWLNSYSLFIF